MKTRDDLVQQIHAERAEWHALLAEIGEDRMEEPGPMGAWTFKDLVAHLLGWREQTIAKIEAGPGGNVPTPWPASMETDDEVNAWIHKQHRDRPLRDVLADADRSYERFTALIETMPDDDLLTPGRWAAAFEWMDTALVDSDFFGHLHEEHEPSIREWIRTR